MGDGQAVAAWRQEEEAVYPAAICLRTLHRPLCGVPDLDTRIENDRNARISYDTGQPARGGCLSVQLIGGEAVTRRTARSSIDIGRNRIEPPHEIRSDEARDKARWHDTSIRK